MTTAAGAGDHDDAAPAGAQVRDGRLHHVVERHHLLLEVVAEGGRLHRAGVDLVHQRAGRVHERVHAPEPFGDTVDERGGGLGVEEVDPHRFGAPARGLDVGRDRTRGVLVAAVGERDVAAPLGEEPAHRRTEAAAAPGHDGDAGPIAEVVHGRSASS